MRCRVQVVELPRPERIRVESERKRVEVAVEYFALAVGERLEAREHVVDLGVVELMAEVGQPFTQRVPAGMLAEHELCARETDVLRTHDLVGLAMLEHAVLMDAGFVRERVVADDRLVARNRRPDEVREQARGGV